MFYGGESNVPGAPGNLRASLIPQGPYTPLPSPGWNPGMIKTPGNPDYRPPATYERILPDGRRVPFAQAPGDLFAGNPSFEINRTPGTLGGRSGEQLRRLYEGGTQQNEKLNNELIRRGIMPGSGPQLPMAFGSSNLPGAVGNMGGIANAQFFDGPQLGQAVPEGEPQKPYGGAPNVPLTPEERARLLQKGSPIPSNFREQYGLPQAQVPAGFQAKYVS